ncbi:YCF48-related protein [Neptuniibacter sp. CAU 1671]|uniref:WD40/YVTN/BNR-like repeat-containing protein n=1 Tax=Neptuniibacter sp. CAU 1671 TaxID=3032593 RepID=UPI0023D9FA58|nr:YCF48-related protein [Neptuniibacter sp. CAU 1671]MDF2180580.1 YCF48-related protein [Neptuniibacter sp. CAU 1671]
MKSAFTWPAFTKKVFCTGFASLLLAGCEAPLNLEGVSQELQKQVRRTDQFQALTVNHQDIYAVGNDGLVLHRTVTAPDWTRSVIPGKPSLIDIAACPDQSLVALSTHKQIFRSTDNAQTWQQIDLSTGEDLMAINCAEDNSIWMVGSFSTILSSSDAGESWEEQSLSEDAMLTGIQFIDRNNILISGEFGLFVSSNDGGLTWNEPQYIPDDFYAHAAEFINLEEGWVGGLSGKILHTQDGGLSWDLQSTPTESPIYGFLRTDTGLYAFGDHSTLLKYQSGKWQQLSLSHPPVYFRDAVALPEHAMLLAGGLGSLVSVEVADNQARLSQK